MKLVRFKTEDGSRSKLGHLSDDGIVQELNIDVTTLDTLLAAGKNWDTLTSNSESYERDTIEFQCPIVDPSHILGVGLNHRGHAEEVGHEIPDAPLFFAKSVSSLAGPGDRIISPDEVDTLQYEAELALVIEKSTRNVTPDEAADHVFGYTLSNDVTAHDLQMADVSASHPWFRSKCFDTFTPIGPTVVPTDAVDIDEEIVSARLNGETVQRLAVRDRVFSGFDIVAEISKYFTLQPGDIVMTGTADGIGEITIGDEIEVVSETLGTLQNTISAP